MTVIRVLLALACALLFPSFSLAQAYPAKPIRMIIPFPPGGPTDLMGRLAADRLTKGLGVQVIADNRGGAGGNIGFEQCAKSPPDGYTLCMMTVAQSISPGIYRKLGYDLGKDFSYVTLMAILPSLLTAHPSLPAKNVKELVALAKARPGQLQYATGGIGSIQHMAMELFLNMTATKMLHVPYKATHPALMDTIAGHVPLTVIASLSALPQVRSGRVRAYGVTSAKRMTVAPEIPTIAEQGVPGYEAVQWFGLLAPAGTPREIVTRLHAGIVRVLQDAEVRKRFVDDGAEATPSRSPEEFGALIRSELAKWGKVVKDSGIQSE
jgi:tripartite-type tricarboxylate transporter receptor subunit TctC